MTSNDLKQYILDILTLENQIHTYQKMEEIYIRKIRKVEEDKNTVFLNDKEDYKRRKFHRSNQVVPAPDIKPECIGKKKSRHGRTIFIYGFTGLNSMYRQVPERWLEGELGTLRKNEHNKYRNKRILAWLCTSIVGILLSIVIKSIIPLPIAVVIALLLSRQIGDENQKEYMPGDEVYDTFMYHYTANYNADLKTKEELFTPQIQKLTTEYENYIKPNLLASKMLLEKLYSQNIIHSKYRDFISIAQLYDYINIGRCNKLDGPDGAYNMFEQENNAGLLMSELDMSLFKLEKFESTMFTLVDLLKQNDKITSNIFTEINRDSCNTLKQTIVMFQNQYSEICERY